MTTFLSVVAILQAFSISLGVGSSTLAILNFFAAIADGIIDDTERRMMGVVYIVLRVAMVLILVTTVLLISAEYSSVGLTNLSAVTWGQLITVLVLFINAMLMTAHLMSTTFGPALQGGSWYTLGFLSALQIVGWIDFTFTHFIMGYIAWLILDVGIINGAMAISKEKAKRLKEEEENT